MHDIDSRRLMFPGLAGLYRAAEPWGDLWLRVVAGGIMIPHSIPKLFGSFAPVLARNVLGPLGFPGPLYWAYFLGLLELVGGVLLALGVLTRPLALAFAVETAIITAAVSWPKGWIYSVPGGGAEFPFLLLASREA
ncbi:MAG TPA: DoxX family protein [Candidatus Binataceae bacterium]|nr:DoxX family protein [Candidatus Binataceae bacterium]